MGPAATRYEALLKIAAGGMATVYLGRLRGAAGFSRAVAIKRAHQHIASDPDFRRLFVAEARVASRIHHPNVVAVLDVEASGYDGELSLVMDYVEGASLAELLTDFAKRGQQIDPRVTVRILLDACAGLHHAHELEDDDGQPLRLVHRDISPQNVLVGLDGVGRIADFGIAKSAAEASVTSTGLLRGKAAYMAPEYIDHVKADHRADLFGLGVVAWESFTGKRLFKGKSEPDTLRRVTREEAPPMSSLVPALAPLDQVVGRALRKDPRARTQTVRAFGEELEAAARAAELVGSHAEVAALVREVSGASLAERRRALREMVERAAQSPGLAPAPAPAPSAPDLAGASLTHAVSLDENARSFASEPAAEEPRTVSHLGELDPLGDAPTILKPPAAGAQSASAPPAPAAAIPAAEDASSLRTTIPRPSPDAAPKSTLHDTVTRTRPMPLLSRTPSDGSTAPTLVRDLPQAPPSNRTPLADASEGGAEPPHNPRLPWIALAIVSGSAALLAGAIVLKRDVRSGRWSGAPVTLDVGQSAAVSERVPTAPPASNSPDVRVEASTPLEPVVPQPSSSARPTRLPTGAPRPSTAPSASGRGAIRISEKDPYGPP